MGEASGSTRDGDQCLLTLARSDPDAFAAFYDRYAERLLRFLAGRLLDVEVALDLMSESFAKALQRRHQFRGTTPEEERAWLFAIAMSEMSHFWRRGKNERKALEQIGVAVPNLSDPELERMEERMGVLSIASELHDEIDRLSPEQRSAVTMRVVDELGYDEIASRAGVDPQVVRARVSRGLRTLAAGLQSRGIVFEDVA